MGQEDGRWDHFFFHKYELNRLGHTPFSHVLSFLLFLFLLWNNRGSHTSHDGFCGDDQSEAIKTGLDRATMPKPPLDKWWAFDGAATKSILRRLQEEYKTVRVWPVQPCQVWLHVWTTTQTSGRALLAIPDQACLADNAPVHGLDCILKICKIRLKSAKRRSSNS